MCKISENIVAVEGPSFTQVNAVFEAHFSPTSNPVYEYYLFHQIKQRHHETTHEFHIRLKEHGQKYRFMDLNQEIKLQVELTTCSNKLRRYPFKILIKVFQNFQQ